MRFQLPFLTDPPVVAGKRTSVMTASSRVSRAGVPRRKVWATTRTSHVNTTTRTSHHERFTMRGTGCGAGPGPPGWGPRGRWSPPRSRRACRAAPAPGRRSVGRDRGGKSRAHKHIATGSSSGRRRRRRSSRSAPTHLVKPLDHGREVRADGAAEAAVVQQEEVGLRRVEADGRQQVVHPDLRAAPDHQVGTCGHGV
jgi:hypothetical protein